MNALKKIRMLRERLGLSPRQAKEALVICLEGVTLNEYQANLAKQLKKLEGLSPCPTCDDWHPPLELRYFSDKPKLKSTRYCSEHCLREAEAKLS